ncbi:MAG: polyprenyl synthetase family protein [Hyphomicrobiaceae bacterium]
MASNRTHFDQRLAQAAQQVETRLSQVLAATAAAPPRLKEAMAHAVLGGGKRFRPCLVIESARIFGIGPEASVSTAAAVELLHCYSLVHDDLPAMDDDELRRGRPTVWKAFDEATAILAGDALLTLAFEILAGPGTHPDPAVRVQLALGLAQASGASGMVGGQQLDLEAETSGSGLHTAAGVQAIQRMKTGALIRFSACAGAVLASAPTAEIEALAAYGEAIGAAFQIADDLLDVGGHAAQVGKGTGKDAKAGKATWISLLGIDGARTRLAQLEREAAAAVSVFGERGDVLVQAATFVAQRQK